MNHLSHLNPRRLSLRVARLLIALAISLIAYGAQAATPAMIDATAILSWMLPTTATDGSALTGAQALTSLQLLVRDAPINDADASSPDATLGANATSYTWTGKIANGGTIYVRSRACNAAGCSVLSGQASKTIQLAAPGAPGVVTITVSFAVAP